MLFGAILTANGINVYSQPAEINSRVRRGILLRKHRVWCFAYIPVCLMSAFLMKSEKTSSWVNLVISTQITTKALSAKLIWVISYSAPDIQNPDSLFSISQLWINCNIYPNQHLVLHILGVCVHQTSATELKANLKDSKTNSSTKRNTKISQVPVSKSC